MRFAICQINETWTTSAVEPSTEVFVRHSNLYKAVGADLSSSRAYVAAGFYLDAADGLSLMAVDRTEKTVLRFLWVVEDNFVAVRPRVRVPLDRVFDQWFTCM